MFCGVEYGCCWCRRCQKLLRYISGSSGKIGNTFEETTLVSWWVLFVRVSVPPFRQAMAKLLIKASLLNLV